MFMYKREFQRPGPGAGGGAKLNKHFSHISFQLIDYPTRRNFKFEKTPYVYHIAALLQSLGYLVH